MPRYILIVKQTEEYLLSLWIVASMFIVKVQALQSFIKTTADSVKKEIKIKDNNDKEKNIISKSSSCRVHGI